MDEKLRMVELMLRHAHTAAVQRQDWLKTQPTGNSRYHNRVAHTAALISLIEELRGIVHQDPDLWDDEPELVPF